MEAAVQLLTLHALPDNLYNITPEQMLKTLPQRQPLATADILQIIAYRIYKEYGDSSWEMNVHVAPLECNSYGDDSESEFEEDEMEVERERSPKRGAPSVPGTPSKESRKEISEQEQLKQLTEDMQNVKIVLNQAEAKIEISPTGRLCQDAFARAVFKVVLVVF